MLCAVLGRADSFTVFLENDILGDSDQYYTHGTRLSYTQEKSEIEQRIYSLGQYIYTPIDKDAVEVDKNDRPYAGWLYLGYAQGKQNGAKYDFWEVQVGMIGPLSYSEQTQKVVHHIFANGIPAGWENQLNNELGVNIFYNNYTVVY